MGVSALFQMANPNPNPSPSPSPNSNSNPSPNPTPNQVTATIFQMVEKHYAIPRAVIFRSEFSVYVSSPSNPNPGPNPSPNPSPNPNPKPDPNPSPSPNPNPNQVELSFRLQLLPSEVYPHFVRLLQALERTPHEYLGEAQYQAYYAEFLRPRAEPVAEPEGEVAFDER